MLLGYSPRLSVKSDRRCKGVLGKSSQFQDFFNKKILASIFYSCSTLNFQFKGIACLVVRELHGKRHVFLCIPRFPRNSIAEPNAGCKG